MDTMFNLHGNQYVFLGTIYDDALQKNVIIAKGHFDGMIIKIPPEVVPLFQ